VRSVVIQDPTLLPSGIHWAPVEAAETITSVIMELPRLQSYALRQWITSQPDIVCMFKTTSDLTHLNICLDFDWDSSGVFAVIN
jgi:hypothetical protein